MNCAALDEHKTSACLKYHMTQAITEKKKKKKENKTYHAFVEIPVDQAKCMWWFFILQEHNNPSL